jgi:hypothetical protein
MQCRGLDHLLPLPWIHPHDHPWFEQLLLAPPHQHQGQLRAAIAGPQPAVGFLEAGGTAPQQHYLGPLRIIHPLQPH